MADLACVLVALIWGFNLAVVKDALLDFSPMTFNGIRLPVAALFMGAFLVWRERAPRLTRKDLFILIGFGLIGNTLYQLLFIYGIEFTKAGNVALLLSSSTVFVALLSGFSGEEVFSRRVTAGIALSLLGVVLVVTEKSELSWDRRGLWGDFLILVCSACWAAYTVFGRPWMKRYSSVAFSTLTFSFGAVGFLVISLPALWAQEWSAVRPLSYVELLFSSIFALAVAYSLWFYGVRRLGSTRTAIYSNLVPFFGVASAWLFLSEPLTGRQLLGGALIVAGTLITRSGTRLREPEDSQRIFRSTPG